MNAQITKEKILTIYEPTPQRVYQSPGYAVTIEVYLGSELISLAVRLLLTGERFN